MRALHYVSMATGNFRLFVTFGGASNLVVDSGSHKLQHYLNAISLKIETSLLTTDGPPEISSDLERAPGAHSIADEFLGGPSIVNEQQNCENTAFHIHTPPFGIHSQRKTSFMVSENNTK